MTENTVEKIVVTAVCLPLIFAYVCRFKSISWFTTRPSVMAFNSAALLFCGLSLQAAWADNFGAQDAAGLAVVGLWLVISWPSWGTGRAPLHVITKPGDLGPPELQPARLRQVAGGRRDY